MTCSELAHSFLFANEGKRKKESKFDQESVKRLNALMQTCGFMMSQVSLPIKWDYRAKVVLAVVL
jgi:glutaminase